MRTRAVFFHEYGGPEVLRLEETDIAAPGPGEALIRQSAAGVNYADIYLRGGQGIHEGPPLPSPIGLQGAGVVEAVGEGVGDVAPGDRVAYVGLLGGYAEARLVPADRLVKLPEGFGEELAAATLLRGLTCEYLVRRLFQVKPGQTVLWHAAAGGVGVIGCQWAKALGATVIGTVGSDEKAELARANGCDHAIVYTREDFVARTMEITKGKGVEVVYDAVGRDTFMPSLEVLKPRGMIINFGTASGSVEPFPLQMLHRKSLIVSRPTLVSYIADRSEYMAAAQAFFEAAARGDIRLEVGARYPLAEASRAHADMEARRTAGAPVLIV